MPVSLSSLILFPAAAVVAALLASTVKRWLAVPVVVFEIVLGMVIGPSVLGWVGKDPVVAVLSNLGLAMLFLLAGYEIDFARITGRPLRRASIGWVLSLVLGVGVGFVFARDLDEAVLVGICLATTALGTILPMLRDAGELRSPFGTAVQAIGTVGEFCPLIAVALFLSSHSPLREAVILVGFAVLIAVALRVAARTHHGWLHRTTEATLHTSSQFGVRLVILLLAALVGLALTFGLDMLLGAFAAGVLVKVLLRPVSTQTKEVVDAKLEAVGFGLLVPIFFVETGVTFDLLALTRHPSRLLLVVLFLALFLVVRGIPAALAAPPGSSPRDRAGVALFGATGLPIIVAVTAIGVNRQEMSTATAAALVGAGLLSVLLFPLLALRRRSGAPAAGREEAGAAEA